MNENLSWKPSSNEHGHYLGIRNEQPLIIHAIEVKGWSSGWAQSFILQFRNTQSTPFICWNSCLEVEGNQNGTNSKLIEL